MKAFGFAGIFILNQSIRIFYLTVLDEIGGLPTFLQLISLLNISASQMLCQSIQYMSNYSLEKLKPNFACSKFHGI